MTVYVAYVRTVDEHAIVLGVAQTIAGATRLAEREADNKLAWDVFEETMGFRKTEDGDLMEANDVGDVYYVAEFEVQP